MRSMLFWAMVLLFVDCVRRVLCWSLVIFIPLSVVQAWTVGSDVRWLGTILTLALGLFFSFSWTKLSAADRARVSWLLVVLLISLSFVFGLGYSIFNQPIHRLVSAMIALSVVMTLLTFWRLTDPRAWYARVGLALTAAYGVLAFLPGSVGHVTVEELFAPTRLVVSLPWFIQPAGFSVAILLPLALVAGVADSVRSMKRGDPPILRERWFEFSCIMLSAVVGLTTLLRVHPAVW